MPRNRYLSLIAAFGVGALLAAGTLYLLVPDQAGRGDPLADAAASSLVEMDTSLQQAPDIALPTVEGDTFRLSDQRGRVVVLNFWATWCPPCREEIPLFVELQRELGDDGLQFVGVSLDQEGVDAVRPFAREMNVNYPIVVGDGTVAPRYGGIRALPTTFLIGPDGAIHGYAPGMVTEPLLRPRLDQLLAMIDD